MSLAPVLQLRLPLIQILDKCSFVGAMWSSLSGLASLIPPCTPFYSSPSTVWVVFVMSMKRQPIIFFLQGTRVATFSRSRDFQTGTKKIFFALLLKHTRYLPVKTQTWLLFMTEVSISCHQEEFSSLLKG